MAVPSEVFDRDRLAAVASSGLLDTEAEPAFDDLAKLAADLIGAPLAFVTVVDDRRSFWKSAIGVGEGERENTVEQSFCQYVVGGEDPLVVTDAANDDRTKDNPSVESMGVSAWAGFPVRTPDGHVLGTFCVVDTARRDWSDRDIRVLKVLSEAASREVALRMRTQEATTALQRAQSVTRTLQQSLLPPSLPETPGLEVSCWHQPAFDGDVVLGDFYDIFITGMGRWGAVVGDVCGHGPDAAKRTALARYTVRASAAMSENPTEVLAMLNDALLLDSFDELPGKFVTAIYSTFESSEAGVEVRLSNGGHPYPLIRRSDGSVEMVEVKGNLLGWFKAPRLVLEEITLAPGDLLVLYTDGLIEARGPDGFFGEEAVMRVVSECSTANEVTERLKAAVLAHGDGVLVDDVAVLSVGVPK